MAMTGIFHRRGGIPQCPVCLWRSSRHRASAERASDTVLRALRTSAFAANVPLLCVYWASEWASARLNAQWISRVLNARRGVHALHAHSDTFRCFVADAIVGRYWKSCILKDVCKHCDQSRKVSLSKDVSVNPRAIEMLFI